MEIRQLRHFLVLSEEMHFGHAAKRLCITQSALSTSIQRLEDDFSVRLFERDSKGVRLTPGGQLMLERAQEVLNQTDRAKSFSAALAAGRLGRLEVGFTSTMVHRNMDKVLEDCRAKLPDIEIYIREAVSQEQLELLRAGRLDAGLVTSPLPPVGVEYIKLYEDNLILCLPSTHALAQRDAIDIAELQHDSFVLPSKAIAPAVHDQLIGFCVGSGFVPRVVFESLHELSTVFLISRGQGVGFVMQSLVNVGIEDVVFVPLRPKLPPRFGYFVWNPARQPPGLQALIEHIRSHAAQSR